MSNELKSLEIDEMSGVDAPANGIPGWMVMKSADPQTAVEAQLAGVYATLGAATALEGAPEEIRKAAETLSGYVEKQLTAPEPEPSLMDKMRSIFKAKPMPPQQDNQNAGAADDDDANGKVAAPAKPKMKKSKGKAKVAQPNGTDDSQNTQDAQDVMKAFEPVVTELEELRKAMTQDNEAMRDALMKAFERIEVLENELTGSFQVDGQDFGTSVEKAAGPSLRDGIMSAFSGNRVTLS